MQDRYAGDFGDFVKLSLLRVLAKDRCLGVAWYLTPDENGGDGQHIAYLDHDQEHRWRSLDPDLYDRLRQMVDSGDRRVEVLEPISLPPSTTFVRDPVPAVAGRSQWFDAAWEALRGCDIVFADPDNGLEPAGFKPGRRKSIKSITYHEIRALLNLGGPVVIYHHLTR